MKITIHELMCAVALGVIAMGAQAQTSDTMKPGAGTRLDATAKAEADYKAAKDACDAKSAAGFASRPPWMRTIARSCREAIFGRHEELVRINNNAAPRSINRAAPQ